MRSAAALAEAVAGSAADLRRSSLLPWLVALAPTLLAGAAVARWVRATPYDDAFITFRYAANLRAGLGLVYNPGEPVLATTTPLFALLLGGLGTLLPSAELAVLGYWLSLAATCLAGALASAICWHEGERAAALLAPIGLILAPRVVLSVGQEIGLVLALGLASFHLWRRRRLLPAALALALLALARPDGVLLAALLLAAELRRSRRLPVRPGLAFALILGGWHLFVWLTYGSPLPFSLAAKTAQAATGWWPTTLPSLGAWLLAVARETPLLAALAALGLVGAGWRARWALLLLAWPLAQLVGFAILGVAFYPWYVAPLHGILGLLAALGVGRLVTLVRRATPRPALLPLAVFLLAAAALVGPAVQWVRVAGRDVPDANMRQYEEIGRWLREQTAADSLVAALELGRLGYYGERPLFDFVGLVKPPVAERLRQRDLTWSVQTYRPDYVVAIPPDRWLLESDWFQTSYAPLRRFADPQARGGQPTTLFVRARGEPPAQAPAVDAGQRFGERIELVGYSLSGPSPAGPAPGGAAVGVVLHWRALRAVEGDYTVFLHALDRQGRLVGQADGQPLGGRWPTSRWEPGETILDVREVAVPPAGEVASLRVGWYLLETGRRLPVVDGAGNRADSVLIATGR